MTRKPIHRFLPLTYKQKIPGVLAGDITQSIRIDTDLQVGDQIAFHGWSGRPYHSPWSFRTAFCEIILAKQISIHEKSVHFRGTGITLQIGDPLLDKLAALDGIEPATGEELVRVLHAMHGKGILRGKVLRWDPAEIKERILSAAIMNAEPVPENKRTPFLLTFKDPLHSPRHTAPLQDFVQLGAFDKSRTSCEGIKEGFVLIRQKQGAP